MLQNNEEKDSPPIMLNVFNENEDKNRTAEFCNNS
jgi:hypothetical protein